jgi:pimeloyl-ACP methyl ester carboxylesterase
MFVITVYIRCKSRYVISDYFWEANMNAQTSLAETATTRLVMVPTSLGAFAVRVAGYGPRSVVLWPSILCDSHIFDGLARDLAADATFVLIDGPGHGASPGTGREFTGAEAGRAMLAVMDSLGIARAVVGGVSWGGMTAAEVALAAPERVEGLVLMNTPMDLDGAHPRFGDRMIALGARWMLGTAMFRSGVARAFFSTEALRLNPKYRDQFHDMLRKADPRQLAAAVRSVILRGSPLRARLAELTVPTLLIAGTEDTLYPLEGQADAALRIPQGRFAPVPGHHVSPIEAPDAVALALRDFLRGAAAR